ncbi:Pentatricopeptide repeat-containing protein [Melia azedarach]|uniref:Pentatricopeptide repeat-containing protein n=1 Tax=Melia azedarach TaxID=155640 RepID=A0ACC1YYW3_MELAZ|nr:Pentatricopeptide repeat-containing protein [Melia azedarach]
MNSATIYKPNTTNSSPHPSSQFPQITKCKNMRDLTQVHAHFIKTGQIRDSLAAAEILRFCAVSDRRNLDYAPFAKTARLQEGKQVHGLIVKFGVVYDEFVISNLVRMYVMCGDMDNAHRLFYKNIVEFVDSNMSLRDKRRQEGNVVLWNVMIDGYVRLGNLRASRALFDEMPQRSVVSWNVMISGYAQNGQFREAIEMFHEMQMGDVSPNYVTLVSVLPAISRLGALELGKWVHLYAEKNEIEIDDVLGSALIDMYSKCGNVEKAIQVFQRIPKLNAIAWSAMIGGFSMHGRPGDAFDCFSRMEQAGVKPSDVVYIGLLSACGHAGLVEEGRFFFNHMINVAGLEPRIEHYGCMVDLLGRAGLLKEAEELIMNMPIKPDDVIWKALLGACKTRGNTDMGERVAKVLMDLAPNDSGAYVGLSNMYASSGNWEGVAEIRLKMKQMDIRKDPGCSWIELDGVIHEFLVEDDSHPKAEEIHSMLEEVSRKLSLSGYRPNTAQVLLNVAEEVKESALHYHSEKIAIAFGLISTKPGTTLRIVKNLRVCEDCHSSIKLISKIYKRKIVVRDRKRFHHFENGSCSCMDFW